MTEPTDSPAQQNEPRSGSLPDRVPSAPDQPTGAASGIDPLADGDAVSQTEQPPPALSVAAPTQAELDALPIEKRLELLELDRRRKERERERHRQSSHQRLNAASILAGVLITAGSLFATAKTLGISLDELRNAREEQITDRYTKATEQLGSTKSEVRTAAIYALERITKDSEPDAVTIRDVLAAYVREHDPAPTVNDNKLPETPDTDVAAALTVLARRRHDTVGTPSLDLHGIRVQNATFPPFAKLLGADLTDANLTDAKLNDANLSGANLTDVSLSGAHLNGANLNGANLSGDADLARSDLTNANLTNANLSGDAGLARSDLTNANLNGANLTNAHLNGANLTNANLTDANLTNADLRGIVGVSEAEVRKMAKVNAHTRFGPP
jgi:uncharacterized protein YjbI with pentapeptide repeats